MRSVIVNLTSLLTKTIQTASLQRQSKRDGLGTGVEVSGTRKNMLKQDQIVCQEGAGRQSSTMLCFPKVMHIVPGSQIMPQLLVTRSRLLQENLNMS